MNDEDFWDSLTDIPELTNPGSKPGSFFVNGEYYSDYQEYLRYGRGFNDEQIEGYNDRIRKEFPMDWT